MDELIINESLIKIPIHHTTVTCQSPFPLHVPLPPLPKRSLTALCKQTALRFAHFTAAASSLSLLSWRKGFWYFPCSTNDHLPSTNTDQAFASDHLYAPHDHSHLPVQLTSL